jgi:hypothetical protein
MAHDPIVEIDMAVPEHFQRAVGLALRSKDATHWGFLTAENLRVLNASVKAGDKVFGALVGQGEDELCVALTGNGPTSEANAEFFGSARKIVLGLVSEVDRLKTLVRHRDALLQSCVDFRNEAGIVGAEGAFIDDLAEHAKVMLATAEKAKR